MVLDVRDTARYLESIAPDSPEAREIISEVYEKRFVKISCTLGERTVDVWVYMGPRSDYLIVPRSFCSCKDFMIRVASTRKTLACKHLVGVELALRLGKKRDLALDADTCVKIAFEVLEKNLSPTLRKALYTAQ
ncbi:MAG: metal-binding protein [Thermosphaera sp.]